VDSEREIAEQTLRRAREVLADLLAAVAEHGSSANLDATRASLEAEIHALETALNDWDEWATRRDAD
jgi:hypothetical protein